MSVLTRIKSDGLKGAFRAVLDYATTRRLVCYPSVMPLVRDKIGLEIGGPSFSFHDYGMLPIYRHAARVDNCNYTDRPPIYAPAPRGKAFKYHKKREPGFTIICEAADLTPVADASYDFILSSHSLEHCANPIKALKQWRRVARPNAPCVIVLPHYRHTFDHRRRPTPLRHLIEDFERDTSEDDLTHIQESIELHDLAKDMKGGTRQEFVENCRRNLETRIIHHHVFDEENAEAMLAFAGLTIVHKEFSKPWNIVLVARM